MHTAPNRRNCAVISSKVYYLTVTNHNTCSGSSSLRLQFPGREEVKINSLLVPFWEISLYLPSHSVPSPLSSFYLFFFSYPSFYFLSHLSLFSLSFLLSFWSHTELRWPCSSFLWKPTQNGLASQTRGQWSELSLEKEMVHNREELHVLLQGSQCKCNDWQLLCVVILLLSYMCQFYSHLW